MPEASEGTSRRSSAFSALERLPATKFKGTREGAATLVSGRIARMRLRSPKSSCQARKPRPPKSRARAKVTSAPVAPLRPDRSRSSLSHRPFRRVDRRTRLSLSLSSRRTRAGAPPESASCESMKEPESWAAAGLPAAKEPDSSTRAAQTWVCELLDFLRSQAA